MFKSARLILLVVLLVLSGCGVEQESPVSYSFGTELAPSALAKWDIDVGPDGVGLPAGSGTAQTGEATYIAKCSYCHGEFGEGMGRFPDLVGTPEDLVSNSPSKNVGSYWPYATTLWDYIYRAMPFGNAQSLTADEVYGITAYILALNNIIAEDHVLDATSLPLVKMPNRHGFVTAGESDILASHCMKNCIDTIEITSRASESQASMAAKEEEKNIGNYHR